MRLFGGGWTFAMVGARVYQDWRKDALSVMALRAKDPRGWFAVNFAPEGAGSASGTNEPFLPWSIDTFSDRIFEVSAESAEQLLVALQGEFYQAWTIQNFEQRKDDLFSS